jgi:two-component system response regulator NreC
MGTRQGLYALVLSDQAILRAALVALLRSQSSIVEIGQAATVDEAMQASTSGRDVILAAETRASATIAIVAELAERGCRMPVLAIAYDDSAMFVRRVLSAGAAGVVTSSASPDELFAALHSVANGSSYVHPSLGGILAAQETVREIDNLSAREREVLRLIALGYTNPQIAEYLVLSVRTIETHRAHLARKLGAESRAQLVRHALDYGLLNGD